MRWMISILLFICLPAVTKAQRQKADSLITLLNAEKTDTGKVKLGWEIAGIVNVYDPELALNYAQAALSLATNIKYIEGQSKSLGAMANTFRKMGNYTKALELNLRKLKLEEQGNNPRNLAMALMNIGIVYRYQEEYDKALKYYYKSDSVINRHNLEAVKYNIYMNLGDVYDRMNNTDSAFSYFNKSLILSNYLKNPDYIGNSMTGLGHTYFKQGNASFALLYYRTAMNYLLTANNDEVFCEASLGLANLYQKLLNKNDSAVYYAGLSLNLAAKDGFMKEQLNAANFLTNHYKALGKTDSAYAYLLKVQQLNDSINSKEKLRELQLLAVNENFRQLEIEENKKIARKERKKQLQLLFIGIFIPGFFLLTLLLSKIRINPKVIKVLGILSLLILFEYLTLLLHPTVAELTNHTPIYEMFIFVAIAAVLIPAHHRFENWIIKKLTHNNESIRLRKLKLKVKTPAG